MIKILYLTLLQCLLLASSYPHFTKNDYIKLEKQSGRIAKNRAMDYQKQVAIFKTYNRTKQLNIVNRYLNQLLPQYDDIIQNKEDYWSTPKEFLTTGYGDCEDYAIIKYFTLIKLGFDKNKLFLTAVHEQYMGGYHMVLTYFKDKNKSPLVLDNLSFKILNLKTRSDIKADVFINSHGVFKINTKHKLKKIAYDSSQYMDLMQKIKKGL